MPRTGGREHEPGRRRPGHSTLLETCKGESSGSRLPRNAGDIASTADRAMVVTAIHNRVRGAPDILLAHHAGCVHEAGHMLRRGSAHAAALQLTRDPLHA